MGWQRRFGLYLLNLKRRQQNDEEWNDHAYHIDTYENTRIVKESTKNVRVKNEN